jgi:hypothetical protein
MSWIGDSFQIENGKGFLKISRKGPKILTGIKGQKRDKGPE